MSRRHYFIYDMSMICNRSIWRHGRTKLDMARSCTLPLSCRKPPRLRLSVQAIGFHFGDDIEPVEKTKAPSPKLSTLTTLASSLLVFGSVLKGAVGEAFLGTLSTATKYQASNKDVLAAYSKFYGLLLQAGFATWEEYLMDQLLLGRDNAFARAVAQGNVDLNSPVLRAVAYDLDILQQLSIPLSRLAESVSDAAPIGGSWWTEAASSAAIKSETKQLPSNAPLSALNMNMPSSIIQKPCSSEELQAWGQSISSKIEWSEGVSPLLQYYHLHGFGITSRNTALRWTKGAFEEGSEGYLPYAPLSVLEPARQLLASNTTRFLDGLPASHCLVAGPSGTGKSWLLWESTLQAGKDKGLRIVEVPTIEQSSILEVARGAARYPRIRFIIVADNVEFPLRGPNGMAADLMAGLTKGFGPSGWPSNVLLYIGATPNSTISFDPIVSRFGLVLATSPLNEREFEQTLMDLMGAEKLADGQAQKAIHWALARGGLTIRNAVMSLSAIQVE